MANKLIKLNHHRLLNGDATNKNDVDLLIGDCKVNLLLTDPPYGINIVNTNGGGKSVDRVVQPSVHSLERERERESKWQQLEEPNHQASKSQLGTVGTPAKPGFNKTGGQPAYGKVGKPRRCTTKTLQTSNR